MEDRGQLMGVPVKLVIALVIGVMSMGILTQFVNTADRTMLRDMRVISHVSGNELTVEVYDAQSRDPLTGSTVVVDYPGGTLAHTLSSNSNSYVFTVPTNGETVIANLRVSHNGYIPWEGEVALSG